MSIDDRGTIQRFLWSGDNLRASYDAAGSLNTAYTTALGYDSILAATNGSTASYPIADGLGSITAWTDSTGAITSSTAYSAFGEASTTAPARGTAPFGYTGLSLDSTGLIQARARSYDPATGRFLSEDPVAAVNRYPYADNNPISLTDPTGQMAVEYSQTNEPSRQSAPAMRETGGEICEAVADVAVDLAVEAAFSHGFSYDPRIRERGLQDPPGHNFPYSFDDEILRSPPERQADGSLLCRAAGSVKGRDGFFEIAYNPDTETIFHRTFRNLR